MIRRTPVGVRALALAAIALFVFVTTASANTQRWSEPDETVTETFAGKELDLQSVTISQNATDALFEAEIQYPWSSSAPHDQVQVFVDTNLDGNADRAVGFVGLSSGQYTVEVREVSTTPANCQRLGSALYTSSPTAMPPPDAAGHRVLEAPFAASHLGGSSYKWVAYVVNDSLQNAAFDYLPNDGNPEPGRSNPVSDDMDGCEIDGDNDFDDGVDTTGPDRAFPVDMTKGYQYGGASEPPPSGPTPPPGHNPPPPDDNPPSNPNAGWMTFGVPVFDVFRIDPNAMPRFAPKNGKDTKFTLVADAERRLRNLNVPVTLKLIARKSTDAETTKQAKFLRSKGKGDEIIGQSPKPGTSLAPVNGKPRIVKIYYYDAADDIRDRNRNCELRSTGLAREALRGKTQSQAAFDLRRLDCTATWTEAPAFGIVHPEVTTARKLRNGSIEVTVGMPRTEQDLLLLVREDPFRTKSRDLSFTDHWRLVKSDKPRANKSRITVQVIERATGRFVAGALVTISDGDDNIKSDLSDANGEAELRLPFEKAGRRTLYAVYNGRNGTTASGWRHLFVADLHGRPFTSASGRSMKASKGVYRASSRSTAAAKRYRYAPATAGAGATGTEIVAPNIVQAQSMTLFRNDRHPAGVAPVFAARGALGIPRNGSVLTCATRGGVIAVSGDVVRASGSPSEACARTLLAVRNAALAKIGTVRNEIVGAPGDSVAQGAAAAEQDGVQAPPTPNAAQIGMITITAGHIARAKGNVTLPTHGLIGEAGGNLVAQGGGNLIGEAGGNLLPGGKIINEGGGSIISEAGGSLITSGFVSNSGGTFSQNSISLVPAGTFGPLPVYGGAIIGQDTGS